MTDLQTSIIDIQTQLAFQEQTIEQLNSVIIDQQKAIDKLQRQLVQLNTKVEEESQHWQENSNLADETPPHY